MSSVITTLLALHGPLVYVVVSVLVLLEAAAFVGLVVPGETALVVAGVLAARGNVSLPLLIGLTALAAVAGDSIGYWIGHRFGPWLQDSRAGAWVGAERWERAHRHVARRGAGAIVAGRWVGILRALVPAVAGITGMPYRRFLAANVAGGVAWVVGVLALGYAAGGSLTAAQQLLGNMTTVGLVATTLGFGYAVLRARRRRATAGVTLGDVASS